MPFCAPLTCIIMVENAKSRMCDIPSVRTAPRTESVRVPRPIRGEFARRRHCAAMDLSRLIRSDTRCKSTSSGACETSPIKLCRIVGMDGIEQQVLPFPQGFLENGILRSWLTKICLRIL